MEIAAAITDAAAIWVGGNSLVFPFLVLFLNMLLIKAQPLSSKLGFLSGVVFDLHVAGGKKQKRARATLMH